MTVSLAEAAHETRKWICSLLLCFLLNALPLRKACAEDHLDSKMMYYQEDNARMKIIAPTVMLERELSPSLTIRIDGIYNSISGATPTGAPGEPGRLTVSGPAIGGGGNTAPVASSPSPVITSGGDEYEYEEEGEEEEEDIRDNGGKAYRMQGIRQAQALPKRFIAKAGASQPAPSPAPSPAPAPSPSPSPAPASGTSSTSSSSSSSSSSGSSQASQASQANTGSSKVPMSEVSDERYGMNVELSKRLDRHTLTGGLSFSKESDYQSVGVAFRDSIDYNEKNTTLTLGTSYAHDTINATTGVNGTKDVLDLLAGLTQVLGPKTLFTANLTVGAATGLLSEPYKVVELNGALVQEQRPDHREKAILFLALTRLIETLNGSAEVTGRFYNDTFGVVAQTYELAWHQKIGEQFMLRPIVRYYSQGAADFYAVRFDGNPESYSSDYRLSAMTSTGYGLKGVWSPTSRFSFDLAYDRYQQKGTDGVTPEEVYPSANVITVGMRIWF